MGNRKNDKKKAKRKTKQKQRRTKQSMLMRKEKASFLFDEAVWFISQGELVSALPLLEKSLRLKPNDKEILGELGYLGYRMKRPDVELKALLELYNSQQLRDENMHALCRLLAEQGRYEQAIEVTDETLALLPGIKHKNKRSLRAAIVDIRSDCEWHLENQQRDKAKQVLQKPVEKAVPRKTSDKKIVGAQPTTQTPKPETPLEPVPLPEIPVSLQFDTTAFASAMSADRFSSVEEYDIALEGYRIRFQESFDNLICLGSLKDVRSLWYQEETARKILKSFRGRALLSDEVGLGKTIEALMVLKEYIQRGMVKSALILTPTPLVSQWQDEIKSKFGLDIPSTDDPDCRAQGESFWHAPFILASINVAKSKKNFSAVTGREYDMIIVDEAHHLKNRNTLNWKLVNALKKRFLLLLTATPVENNLMELYNLITLLKPGQLKTATAFRDDFMTRGDPTDPQNRGRLKELLGEVMIRNTRALAKIDIPPRMAQTIRIESSSSERQLYERITTLVKNINQQTDNSSKLLLKTLLEEAGSSPRAVGRTLSRMLEGRDLTAELEHEVRAISNLCACLDETEKNRVLLKLLKSAPGKKIVFVKYLGTLDQLSDFMAWQNVPHALFHGGMNNQKKDEQIQRFRTDVDVLVATEIGGEGRNLQFCHQMINYDLPWNPMKIEQRIGRIHRIGQEKEVLIYNLCAAGSLEDYILEILDRKINMFEMVIGEIDMILGRVSGEKDFAETVFDIWLNASSGEEKQQSFNRLASELKQSKTRYQKTKELDEKLFGENYEL